SMHSPESRSDSRPSAANIGAHGGPRRRETGGRTMIVGVPRESFPGERRVALVPLVVPTLTKAGFEVVVEAGAGAQAGYPDKEYAARGARVVAARAEVFRAADVVVQVLCYGSNDKTGKDDLPHLRRGQTLVGFLRPL